MAKQDSVEIHNATQRFRRQPLRWRQCRHDQGTAAPDGRQGLRLQMGQPGTARNWNTLTKLASG